MKPLTSGRAIDSARLVDHSGALALRIPFLAAAFPEAQFVYLYHEPRQHIPRILDAWRSGRFVTYPGLPSWDGPPWSLPLFPGWQALRGHSLAQIALAQWTSLTSQILSDLAELPIDLGDLVSLHLQGALDNLVVTVERAPRGPGAEGDLGRNADERLRLREFGRRLRNRLLK